MKMILCLTTQCGGIRIVERYIITVKLLIEDTNADMWRVRGGCGGPIPSVTDWRIVRNAQTSGIAAGESTCAPERASVYIIGRS